MKSYPCMKSYFQVMFSTNFGSIAKYVCATCLFFYEWEHRMGTMCPFLSLHPLRKGKGIKQFYRISNKGNKKKSCHLVPKVVINLSFEGSRKSRRRERVPKAGSRGEETITEPINSRIGKFHTIVVGKCCLPCGTWPSHWRWNTGANSSEQ